MGGVGAIATDCRRANARGDGKTTKKKEIKTERGGKGERVVVKKKRLGQKNETGVAGVIKEGMKVEPF